MNFKESFADRHFSRRQFLRGTGIGIVTASAVLAGFGGDRFSEKELAHVLEIENYKIYINSSGLPFKLEDPLGRESSFNLRDVNTTRAESVKGQEPQLVTLIPLFGKTLFAPSAPVYSKEHPRIARLPEDVLSDEELRSHGIKIIQAENTNLYIRETGFVPDAPLAQFATGKRKLIVALLDFPVVSELAVSDSKYDELRHLFNKQDIDTFGYRAKKIEEADNNLDVFRKKLKQIKGRGLIFQKGELEELEGAILGNETEKYLFENNMVTDDEIAAETNIMQAEGSGTYYSPEQSGVENTAVILVSVGKIEGYREYLRIYFDSNGVCRADNYADMKIFGDKTLKASQTHPDPDTYIENVTLNPNKSKFYPYGAQTPGLIVRHEFEHDKLIKETSPANFSEYDTDMQSVEGIRMAWNKWKQSGYRDDSGYYFVFSLKDGGFILTAGKGKFSGDKGIG